MNADEITSLPSRFARRAPEPGWPSFERCLERFLHGQNVHQRQTRSRLPPTAGEAHGRIRRLTKDFRPNMSQSISSLSSNVSPNTTPPVPPPPIPSTVPAAGFGAFGLTPPLLRALADEGYLKPTPIQTEAIPHVLAGR